MLNKQIVRTRIAPSPTGEDLHIGNAYTALINYIFARKNDGKFIIRIEDTDQTRLVQGSETKILQSLKWLGIQHDEGPDLGGRFAPYRQSERLELYKKHAEKLVKADKAYYCTCTPERLATLREEQVKKKLPPMYDGRCKNIRFQLSDVRKQKYVIRLNVPDEGITRFTDLTRGEISFENKLIDDQVILKSDGFPTYHLGVVVDDHVMKISHIIRGEEWISSTPKHVLLYQFFGWNLPKFAHMPLLRNPDKSKLSKRKNPVWVSWYKDQGILPESLLNYLGTLTWNMPDGRDIFSVSDMITHFRLEDVKTTAPIFNTEKLKWLNGEYIRKLPNNDLFARVKEYVPKDTNLSLVKKLIPLTKERMKQLTEFAKYLQQFVKFSPVSLSEEDKGVCAKFKNLYLNVRKWKGETIGSLSKDFVKKENFNLRKALMVVRLALTGEKVGLPLFETMEILGKNEVLERIQSTLNS